MTDLPPPLQLQPAERRDLVLVTQRLLSDLYCHLPQKRARYGADPVVRLQRMLDSGDLAARGPMSHRLFIDAYLSVLHGLRDLHTGLTFDDPKLRGRVAALPLFIERCGSARQPRYLVTKTAADIDAAVAKGAEVSHWNGVPIDVAVSRLAAHTRGANAAAALARAVEHLTVRPLDEFIQPDEDWVTLTLADGAEHRLLWRRISGRKAAESLDAADAGIALGLDHTGRSNQVVKRDLFTSRSGGAGDCFRHETRRIGGRRIGYLRLYSFVPRDLFATGQALAAALRGFEADACGGIVVDIRNNPGGAIVLAEQLLGLLRADPVIARFSFLATALTRQLCDHDDALRPWAVSVRSASTTGDAFSAALPITDRRFIPAQVTDLPAILITDATTYSSGDLFAAGWVDNGIGPIIATASTTGAGGANVWTLNQIRSRLPEEQAAELQLPPGLDLRLSVRRALRAGDSDSLPIEDLGVRPTTPEHILEPEDLLGDNGPLLAAAVRRLPRRRRLPAHRLHP
jgi:hypothetical protein